MCYFLVILIMFLLDFYLLFRMFPIDTGFSCNCFSMIDALFSIVSICLGVFFCFNFFVFKCFNTYCLVPVKPSTYLTVNINGKTFIFNFFDFIVLYFFLTIAYVSIISCTCSVNSTPEGSIYVSFVVNITCYQWGWSFDFSKFCDGFSYDVVFSEGYISFKNSSAFSLFLPFQHNILWNLCSLDVIHSVGCESLGVKIDSIPGHIASTVIMSECCGFCYVYCSEFCGLNHSFMNFRIEFIDVSDFILILNILKS